MAGIVRAIRKFEKEITRPGGLPDIDTDFQSGRRLDVKKYMEEKYGKDHVFSVGTYSTLKIKAALKDVGRIYGVEAKYMNYITKMIVDAELDFTQLLASCQSNPRMMEFVQKFPKVVEGIRVLMGNPRSRSIHAAAVVITPKKDQYGQEMECYDWLPIVSHDGLLISEWEGGLVEAAGFLKEDILGTSVQDKLQNTVRLIKESKGEEIELLEIPLNDKDTYEMFHDGWTQDVFQFNSDGMTKFLQDLKPDNVEDVIAANALYRPATMSIDAHSDYVKRKHGEQKAEYDWGLREITYRTYGFLVYQEQFIQAVQKVGGFSLQEADAVRRAMGKKKADVMDSYKNRFIEGSIKNGCDEIEAIKIWLKIEKGSSYSFNRSHAACYAIQGYWCMWLKTHYPAEFYTTSLQFASDKDMPGIISEIQDSAFVKIVPPDVNNSSFKFTTDYKNKEIFWAIANIKFVGENAVKGIVEEREKSGPFKSMADFLRRVDGKRIVNSRQIINMILSGCFDRVENIQNSIDRLPILKKYSRISEVELSKDLFPDDQIMKPHFWSVKQIELSGLGTVNYKSLMERSSLNKKYKTIRYLEPSEINNSTKVDNVFIACGLVLEVSEMESKKSGSKFGKLSIQSNTTIVKVTIWNDIWEKIKESMDVKLMQNKIIAINGKLVFDRFYGANALVSYRNTEIEIIS